MLAEHAEAVHAEFVDKEEDFGDVFCDFFLEFFDDFEDVVVAEDGVHSEYDFPDDEKYIFFDIEVEGEEELFVFDSDGVEGVNDDVEEDVVHALGVLDA